MYILRFKMKFRLKFFQPRLILSFRSSLVIHELGLGDKGN